MEDSEIRNIRDGSEYDHLFPKSKKEVIVIKRSAKLEDTINFLPKAIRFTKNQTDKITQKLLWEFRYKHGSGTLFDFCKYVWEWTYAHIHYRKDEVGKEQIQSPQYTWRVRKGDCDDYTVFLISILQHHKKLRIILRIAMYNEDNGYQHIYPVVFLPDGTQVIMDCVAKKFNYEVPYIEKIDKNMELQFLNGIPDTRTSKVKRGIDADDLLEGYEGDDVGDLGKGKVREKLKTVVKKVQNSKISNVVRKGLHVANRVNPAAALLRSGILIALKTNLFKIAERLRFSYLTPEQAQAQQLDMTKYNRLIGIRDQLEKVFFRAGGKIENFKKEILTGKGNKDKQVPLSGFGVINRGDYTLQNSMQEILGFETYNSELSGVEGFGELGIATAAAVTAATTVLTAIAALLKSIGSLRKKDAGGGDGESATSERTTNDESSATESFDADKSSTNATASTDDATYGAPRNVTNNSMNPKSNGGGDGNTSSNAETSATTNKAEGSENENTSDDTANPEDSSENSAGGDAKSVATNAKTTGVFTKAVNWVKANPLPATGIGLLIAGILIGTVKYLGKDDKKEHKQSLAGLPHKKKKKKHFHSHKVKYQKLR